MLSKYISNFAFVSVTGAKVNAKDRGLLTPLHRAAASRNEVCPHFYYFKNTEDRRDLTTRYFGLTKCYLCVAPQKAVELLLKHGAKVNTQDKYWHTPLHMAAAKWATGCAEALIPHMCSMDVADRSGRTPLHHAAHSGHEEVKLFVFLLTSFHVPSHYLSSMFDSYHIGCKQGLWIDILSTD